MLLSELRMEITIEANAIRQTLADLAITSEWLYARQRDRAVKRKRC